MRGNALEIYVHIPFCKRKCPYCDFLSFPCEGRAGILEDEIRKYFNALNDEIKAKAYLGKGKKITSVFFGGGTPSYPPAKYIVGTLESTYENFDVANDAEITIEANPATLNGEKLKDYREDLGHAVEEKAKKLDKIGS